MHEEARCGSGGGGCFRIRTGLRRSGQVPLVRYVLRHLGADDEHFPIHRVIRVRLVASIEPVFHDTTVVTALRVVARTHATIVTEGDFETHQILSDDRTNCIPLIGCDAVDSSVLSGLTPRIVVRIHRRRSSATRHKRRRGHETYGQQRATHFNSLG